jgi:hypothetical protein
LELRLGIRPHVVDPGHALQRLLQRHRGELLDLFWRKPQAGRLDLDGYRRELREHVDLLVADRDRAKVEQHERQPGNNVPEPEARRDDPAHWWSP